MKREEYRCYFEGQQEEMYFKDISQKIKKIKPDFSIKFKSMDKLPVLEKSSTQVPKLAVFDYDLNKIEFEKKVNICKKTRVLYSNLNFDLWLLLHKISFRKTVQSNDAYVQGVREQYNLAENANIKSKNSMEKIMSQIEIDDVKKAIKNCNDIMNEKIDSDKIYVNPKFYYYNNPALNIYQFWDDVFKKYNI